MTMCVSLAEEVPPAVADEVNYFEDTVAVPVICNSVVDIHLLNSGLNG